MIERRDVVEEPPGEPSSLGTWLVILAGPLIWTIHFIVVYFPSEAACASPRGEESLLLERTTFTMLVVVSTALAGVAAIAAAAYSWRRSRDSSLDASGRAAAWVGTLLAIGSVISIVAVGVPVLFLHPC